MKLMKFLSNTGLTHLEWGTSCKANCRDDLEGTVAKSSDGTDCNRDDGTLSSLLLLELNQIKK